MTLTPIKSGDIMPPCKVLAIGFMGDILTGWLDDRGDSVWCWLGDELLVDVVAYVSIDEVRKECKKLAVPVRMDKVQMVFNF